MQQFNFKYINALVLRIKSKTDDIKYLLRIYDSFDDENIIILNTNYQERLELINELNGFIKKSEFELNTEIDKKKLIELINPLLEQDKQLVIELDKRLKNINSKLRNLVKQKSLLLYTKDKNYEH